MSKKTTTTTNTTPTAAELYELAEIAVSTNIRTAHANAGDMKLTRLQRDRVHDAACRRDADILAEEAAEREAHEAAADAAAHYQRIANAKRTPTAERKAAAVAARELRDEAAAHLAHAQALFAAFTDHTYTDRADLTHEALAAHLAALADADPAEDEAPDTFRAMCRAAERARYAAGKLDTARRWGHTAWENITHKEAAAIRARYEMTRPTTAEEAADPGRGKAWTDWTRSAYWTADFLEKGKAGKDKAGKPRPAGWYKRMTYKTESRAVYIDAIDPDSREANIIDPRAVMPGAGCQQDIDDVRAWFDAAKLNDREREVCRKLLTDTAISKAEEAADAVWTDEARQDAIKNAPTSRAAAKLRQEAREAANNAYKRTLWDWAFSAANVRAASTRSEMRARIIAAAEAARKAPAADTLNGYICRTMRHKYRPAPDAAAAPVWDGIAAARAAAADHAAAPVVDWTHEADTADAKWLTPEEYRAALPRSVNGYIIEEAKKHKSPAADAELNAGAIALQMLRRMSLVEIDEISRARMAEIAEARAALERLKNAARYGRRY